MKKEEVQSWDWERILLGQTPVEFLLEVFIRTLFVYLLLLVILRLLGKRMDGQLTLIEMAVMITFGAIVAVPMQLPDKGVLGGVIALFYVLIFQRGLNWLTVKNKTLEDITQGTVSTLVKNGLIQLDEMEKASMSKQHLFTALRGNKIYNLGKVKRVYFEACGMINTYLEDGDKPGLPILPSDELDFILQQTHVDKSSVACCNCGFVTSANKRKAPCSRCGKNEWIEAIF
jgi:uncharacterized membrane protein YcaP (DUF421 family)